MRMGTRRKTSEQGKGRRRWQSGWKKGEDRHTDLERQRAFIFLEEKQKKVLGAVPSSEELQEASVVEMVWRDASCPPCT